VELRKIISTHFHGHLLISMVPEGELFWNLVSEIIDVVEYITAPGLSEGATYFLDDLVEKLLTSFKSLFPDRNITPKMHYLVHYGWQIRCSGVPTEKITLRFESKYGHFNNISNQTKKINITKTFVERHQYYMYLFYKNYNFFDVEIETTGSKEIPLHLLDNDMKMHVSFLLNLWEKHVTKIKSLKLNGSTYSEGDVLVMSHTK